MKLRFFSIYIALFALFLLSGLSGAALSAEWKSMFPPLTPNQINDSYTPDGNVVYLAGNGGTIIKYDGSDFTLMDTPTMLPLYGIHGTGPTNIWAVGGDNAADSPEEKGVVLHYDGSKWTKISAPVPSGAATGYSLSDVYVVSATNVWVVMKGRYNVFRWNGSAWESSNPLDSIPSGGFNKVCGASASAIWFVGDNKNMAFWNGNEFRDITDATSGTYNITSCWAADSNTLFTGSNSGAIAKWDSEGNYQQIDYDWREKTVSGIAGTSANDVYFIGYSGFFVHYNGTSGTWITPENDIFIRNTMTRVSNGDWIVGTERGIQKLSNNTLTEISTPSYLKSRRIYTAFWNNGLWIVPSWLNEFAPIEVYMTTGRRLVIYPPEGKSWDVIGANSAGDDDLRVYVQDFDDYEYYLYRYSGRKWTEWTPPGYYSGMHDILRTEGGELFAVLGPEGNSSGYACLVNDVSTVCAPGGSVYNALAACDETVYAVGNGGAISVYRDGAWTSEESGTDNNLTAVACSESEVYAAGEDRTAIWKTSNGSWQPVSGVTVKGASSDVKKKYVFTGITYDAKNGFTASYKAPETDGSRWISFIYTFDSGTATMEYGWLGPNISLETVTTDGTNVYAVGSGYNNPGIIIYSGTPLEYDPNLPDEGLFYLDDAIILLQVIAGLNPDADLTKYFKIFNNEKIGLSEAIHILKDISE